jgi:hypothetical protein
LRKGVSKNISILETFFSSHEIFVSSYEIFVSSYEIIFSPYEFFETSMGAGKYVN